MRNVVITRFGLRQIKSIYAYYNYNVSAKIATQIKTKIISCIKTLKELDVEWEADEFLIYLNKNHRRLICGNYKIVYYYNSQLKVFYVTDIFDSRQDPTTEKG